MVVTRGAGEWGRGDKEGQGGHIHGDVTEGDYTLGGEHSMEYTGAVL